MRVATWCIGGVRGYLDVLCHWLERRRPDVVALQKIRVSEEDFPTEALGRVGYRSAPLRRQSRFGVALLSRHGLPALEILDRGLPSGDSPDDDGFLTARIGDLVVSSVYAPYGNPAVRGKEGALAYKVAWLDRLIAHLKGRRIESDRSLLCGDFNVLPDVPAERGVLNCTLDEQKRLQTILETGFVDLYRRVNPVPEPGLNYGFNRRLPPTTRLQLVLGSESIADSVASERVDLEYRAPVDGLPGRTWPASAPVIVDFADSV
ncbi:MAG: endonuclease/exonuclease/phosphatase family protein [Acidobacteriota bacterium]|nr:endonuclease/exonuclease/phosphatase family protein [Acidobacteriota bacterium]MDE3266365.1 endonuclease/exonuclease/phosphatase family protein [Acidobacteriota bacterium]